MIRQTFEFIKGKYPLLWSNYCKSHSVMYEIEDIIAEATPSFQMNIKYQQKQVCNIKIVHPMFQTYEEVRKICLRLLQNEGDNIYNREEDESFGLILDISLLWENFIAIKLLNEYEHLIYKKTGIKYAKDDNKTWYPDFIEKAGKQKPRNVFDAKYKNWDYNNDDMHQLLSYLYITGGNECGVIYPVNSESEMERLKLNPFTKFYDEEEKVWCYKLPFYIYVPDVQNEFNYNDYCKKMEENIERWKGKFNKKDAFLKILKKQLCK